MSYIEACSKILPNKIEYIIYFLADSCYSKWTSSIRGNEQQFLIKLFISFLFYDITRN